MSGFEAEQQRYYTHEMGRSIPTKSTVSEDALRMALGDIDPIMPGSNERKQEAAGFLSTFQTSSNITQRDAQCRAFQSPSTAMRDAEARTGCGWWYTYASNRPSVGAYGSRNGPMNPMMETQYGNGEWIWNMKDAQQKESSKQTAKVKICKDLDYFKQQSPNIGWCDTMNRAIMTDGNGNPAYPNAPGGYCPPGEKIAMTSAECPLPPQPSPFSPPTPAPVGISTICSPDANGALSPQCLRSLTNTYCSPAGTLSTAFSNGYPSTSQDFMDANSYLTERGFSLNSGLLNDGRVSQQTALQSIVGLQQYANSGTKDNSTAAALNMCYGSPFDPCNIPSSKTPPYDIKCIKSVAIKMGYSSNGQLLQIPMSEWNAFPTWGDLIAKLIWWKNLADKGPEFFGRPSDQKTAIDKVYKINVEFPRGDAPCSPTMFPGLQVWYDAEDPYGNGSVPANGTPIYTWFNKAGLKQYNAGAYTGRAVPATYSAARRSLYFNGRTLYATNYPASPTSETIFMVFNNPDPDIFRRFLVSSSYGSRSFDSGGTGSGKNSVGFSAPGTQWQAATPNGSYESGTTAIATGFIQNGTTNVSINGGNSYSGPANYNQGTTFLGSYPYEPYDQAFKGEGMEIIIYNTVLSKTQIQQVEGYLAWKWGLQPQLVSGHPFKMTGTDGSQKKTPTVMYGPWIGGEERIQAASKLPNGEIVYLLQSTQYVRMISESGVAKYYVGRLADFNPNSFNSYTDVGQNYLLK